MLTYFGRKLTEFHDTLRFAKDAAFVPLVKVLPRWLTPNHVTLFRIAVLLVWFPYAIWQPSLPQIYIFLTIYFMDLLDGAMARLQNRVTSLGEYMDHVSDKFSNVAVLVVLFGLTGHQLTPLLYFIWSDMFMALWLAVEGYMSNRLVTYIRVPIELVVKTAMWVYLIVNVFPLLT